jgi:hypothetical protein
MSIFYFAANTNCPHCNSQLSMDMKLASYCGSPPIKCMLNSCTSDCSIQYSESIGNDPNYPGLQNRVLDYWACAQLERRYIVAVNYQLKQTTINYREGKLGVIAFLCKDILEFDLTNRETFEDKVKMLLVFA